MLHKVTSLAFYVHSSKALIYFLESCVHSKNFQAQYYVFSLQKFPDDIKEVFGLLTNITFPKWLTEEQLEKGMEQLEELTSHFLDEAK